MVFLSPKTELRKELRQQWPIYLFQARHNKISFFFKTWIVRLRDFRHSNARHSSGFGRSDSVKRIFKDNAIRYGHPKFGGCGDKNIRASRKAA